MNVTFGNEDLASNEYLGEGTHLCTVSAVTEKSSKAGKPMLEVEMTANGKKTKDYFLTSEHKFKLAGFALACGFPKEALLAGGFDTVMLKGKKLNVERKITGKEMYQGKEQNVWENSYAKATESGGTVAGSFTEENIPF